jgi:hypothetical protein
MRQLHRTGTAFTLAIAVALALSAGASAEEARPAIGLGIDIRIDDEASLANTPQYFLWDRLDDLGADVVGLVALPDGWKSALTANLEKRGHRLHEAGEEGAPAPQLSIRGTLDFVYLPSKFYGAAQTHGWHVIGCLRIEDASGALLRSFVLRHRFGKLTTVSKADVLKHIQSHAGFWVLRALLKDRRVMPLLIEETATKELEKLDGLAHNLPLDPFNRTQEISGFESAPLDDRSAPPELVFQNDTDFDVKVYVAGSGTGALFVRRHAKVTLPLEAAGEYEVFCHVREGFLPPFVATRSFEAGMRYLGHLTPPE